MRHSILLAALTTVLLAGAATIASAAPPCRDAKGHFTKCPEAAKKPVRCKDAKGKFAKCGSAGAKPA